MPQREGGTDPVKGRGPGDRAEFRVTGDRLAGDHPCAVPPGRGRDDIADELAVGAHACRLSPMETTRCACCAASASTFPARSWPMLARPPACWRVTLTPLVGDTSPSASSGMMRAARSSSEAFAGTSRRPLVTGACEGLAAGGPPAVPAVLPEASPGGGPAVLAGGGRGGG